MRYRRIPIVVLFGNLTIPVLLLIVGSLCLFRWEKGDLLFWIASAVFVAGALGFYLWRRGRSERLYCPGRGRMRSEIRSADSDRFEARGRDHDRRDAGCELRCQGL